MISNQRRDKFFIPAGKTFRVRFIMIGDEFGLSKDGFKNGDGSVLSVGKYVYADETDGYPMHVVNGIDSVLDGALCGVVLRQRMTGCSLITEDSQFLGDNAGYGHSRVMYDVRVIKC